MERIARYSPTILMTILVVAMIFAGQPWLAKLTNPAFVYKDRHDGKQNAVPFGSTRMPKPILEGWASGLPSHDDFIVIGFEKLRADTAANFTEVYNAQTRDPLRESELVLWHHKKETSEICYLLHRDENAFAANERALTGFCAPLMPDAERLPHLFDMEDDELRYYAGYVDILREWVQRRQRTGFLGRIPGAIAPYNASRGEVPRGLSPSASRAFKKIKEIQTAAMAQATSGLRQRTSHLLLLFIIIQFGVVIVLYKGTNTPWQGMKTVRRMIRAYLMFESAESLRTEAYAHERFEALKVVLRAKNRKLGDQGFAEAIENCHDETEARLLERAIDDALSYEKACWAALEDARQLGERCAADVQQLIDRSQTVEALYSAVKYHRTLLVDARTFGIFDQVRAVLDKAEPLTARYSAAEKLLRDARKARDDAQESADRLERTALLAKRVNTVSGMEPVLKGLLATVENASNGNKRDFEHAVAKLVRLLEPTEARYAKRKRPRR